MRPLVPMILILASAVAGPASGQPDTLHVRGPQNEMVATSFNWGETRPLSGEIVDSDRGAALRITNSAGTATTTPILVIDHPAVGDRYVVFGDIRYEDVQGGAYFEMWNVILNRATGQTERYFTRTLAARGPMGTVYGRSGWRLMQLPFDTMGKDVEVLRLEIGIHMPGPGQVEVGALTLNGSTDVPLAPGVWFTDRVGGMIGGIVGSFFGLGFAMIGMLAGRGRARRFVMAAFVVLTLLGAGLFVVGLVALAQAQPVHVVYSLGFPGLLILVLGLALRRQIARRYEAFELRKMEAMDRAG